MKIEKPKLIIIAGPNGSGKTSVTGKILEHQLIETKVRSLQSANNKKTELW